MTQIIQSLLNNDKYKWIEKDKYDHANDNGLVVDDITFENVCDKINELQPDPPKKVILKVIEDKTNSIIEKNNQNIEKLIQNNFDYLVSTNLNGENLKNAEEIKTLVKTSNEKIVQEILKINNRLSRELITKLSNDPLYNAPFKKPLS
jgi:predicted PilT family ATPase